MIHIILMILKYFFLFSIVAAKSTIAKNICLFWILWIVHSMNLKMSV